MPTEDAQRFRQGLENERENLDASDDVVDADKEAINRWLRWRDGDLAISS